MLQEYKAQGYDASIFLTTSRLNVLEAELPIQILTWFEITSGWVFICHIYLFVGRFFGIQATKSANYKNK